MKQNEYQQLIEILKCLKKAEKAVEDMLLQSAQNEDWYTKKAADGGVVVDGKRPRVFPELVVLNKKHFLHDLREIFNTAKRLPKKRTTPMGGEVLSKTGYIAELAYGLLRDFEDEK